MKISLKITNDWFGLQIPYPYLSEAVCWQRGVVWSSLNLKISSKITNDWFGFQILYPYLCPKPFADKGELSDHPQTWRSVQRLQMIGSVFKSFIHISVRSRLLTKGSFLNILKPEDQFKDYKWLVRFSNPLSISLPEAVCRQRGVVWTSLNVKISLKKTND